jgi:hypothetical protein
MIRLDNISKQIGHQIRLACHFFETLPATAIVARAGAANGKFARAAGCLRNGEADADIFRTVAGRMSGAEAA